MNPPFHIPFAVKIGEHEAGAVAQGARGDASPSDERAKPVPSLLRGFSAPVILNYPYSEAELLHLMANDDDPFNRWEAGQRLAADHPREGRQPVAGLPRRARKNVLRDPDPAFVAEALALPAETFLAEQMEVVDPDRLHESRNTLRRALAAVSEGRSASSATRQLHSTGPYSPDARSMGKRALRNLCLGYLGELGLTQPRLRAVPQRGQHDRLDGRARHARELRLPRAPARARRVLRAVEGRAAGGRQVARGAGRLAPARHACARSRQLLAHPAFDIKVPNKVYALIRTFAANHVRFHAADGGGYEFLADQVIALNALNPQVAARMARAFDRWRKFDAGRQAKAQRALERIRDTEGLSKDVGEIVGERR